MRRTESDRLHGELRLPEGFVWVEHARSVAALDAAWRPALEAAGLLAPESVRAQLRRASGAPGRARIARVALAGQDDCVALRGLRRGGWLGPLLGAGLAGPTRPFRELVVTARLLAAGAPVPRPVLALAWQRGPTWNAALATHFIEGAVDAAELLAAAPARRKLRAALSAAGRAVRRFHDAGGSHPDLHLANLLLRESGDRVAVFVIDLDGARVGAPPDPAERMAQLMRLQRSLYKRNLVRAAGGLRGSLCFLHAYVGGDRALRCALLARLPAERRRLARHALLYREHRGDA